jgi:hypothetical protein
MKINIVALEENHKLLNCPGEMGNNEMFSPVLNGLSFGYRENGRQVLLLSRGQGCMVMEVSDENENVDVFGAVSFLLANFVNKNKVDTDTAFKIIDTLIGVKSELPVQRTVYPIFSLLGWLPSKKGEDAYKAYPKFTDKLRGMLQAKKVALNDAFLFHLHMSDFSYDNILDVLPENLSFSECNLCLKMLTEIIQYLKADCMKKDTNIASEMIKKLSDTKNKADFMDMLKKLRYPKVSQLKQRFSDYLSSFNFPGGVSVTTDEFFEKNVVNMTISFSDKSSLEKKLTRISEELKKQNDVTDYFCIKNLLEEK